MVSLSNHARSVPRNPQAACDKPRAKRTTLNFRMFALTALEGDRGGLVQDRRAERHRDAGTAHHFLSRASQPPRPDQMDRDGGLASAMASAGRAFARRARPVVAGRLKIWASVATGRSPSSDQPRAWTIRPPPWPGGQLCLTGVDDAACRGQTGQVSSANFATIQSRRSPGVAAARSSRPKAPGGRAFFELLQTEASRLGHSKRSAPAPSKKEDRPGQPQLSRACRVRASRTLRTGERVTWNRGTPRRSTTR